MNTRTRTRLATVLALALLLICAPLAVAAPGDLDPSFDGDGKVTTDLGSTEERAEAVAVDDSGRIVVAGVYNQDDFAVVRYLPDGSLDTSFDDDGRVITDLGGGDQAWGRSAAIDSDGRIVVAGGSKFAVARYNPDGSLDATFDADGIATIDLGVGYDMVLDEFGRIVVAGYLSGSSDRDFAVVRYNPDGSPDTTFDGDGKVTTDFAGGADVGIAVTVDGAGRIVVAGRTGASGSRDLAIARYLSDGSLDTAFDGDGKKVVDFGAGTEEATAVLADGENRIAIALITGDIPDIDFAIARFNEDGSPDLSFGVDGEVLTDFIGGIDVARTLALDGAGHMIAAGVSCTNSYPCAFALARYQPDGTLDTTLDGDGKVTATLATSGYGYAVALDASSRIVTAGYAWNGGDSDIGVARFTSDGSLDTTFDGDGSVVTSFPGGDDRAYAVTVDSAGRILAGGTGCNNVFGCHFALARYRTDGAPDTSFGGDGSVATNIGPEHDDIIRAIAVDGSGRIVAAGYAGDPSAATSDPDFAVARYLPDGSLDPGFGSQGWSLTDFATDRYDRGYAMALDGFGRIVVAGASCGSSSGGCMLALARYNANGSLDSSFDGDGKVTVDFPGTSDTAYAIAIDGMGRIIVAGHEFGLARFDSGGSLDTTFDGDGVKPIGFSGQALALDSAGRIVVAGYWSVARYNPDGSPDTSFDGDGQASTGFYGQTLAIDGSGRILVAGYAGSYPQYDFVAARYNSDGSPDTTFSGDGQVTTDFTGTGDEAYAMALDRGGRIVVAGFTATCIGSGCHNDFALVRYLGDPPLPEQNTYLPLILR